MSCHGIDLPILKVEETNAIKINKNEDECKVLISHKIQKNDYISFIHGVYFDTYKLVKLYSENNAGNYFKISGLKTIYFYDIKRGLFKQNITQK